MSFLASTEITERNIYTIKLQKKIICVLLLAVGVFIFSECEGNINNTASPKTSPSNSPYVTSSPYNDQTQNPDIFNTPFGTDMLPDSSATPGTRFFDDQKKSYPSEMPYDFAPFASDSPYYNYD